MPDEQDPQDALTEFDEKIRPDGPLVSLYHDYYKELWSGSQKQWREYDTYFQRTFDVWDKSKKNQANRPFYRRSTPTTVIQRAVDQLMGFDPSVHREPVGEAADSKEDADRTEIALKAIINDSIREETVSPFKQLGRNMLQYGYAPIKGPVLASDVLSLEKKIPGFWNPIRIRAINPSQVLMDPWVKRPRIAIELDAIPARRLEQLTRIKAGPQQRKFVEIFHSSRYKPFDLIPVIHFWNENWHAIRIAENKDSIEVQDLWTEANPMGFPPFSHGFAGFGINPVENEKNDPKYMAIGLSHAVLETYKVQAQSDSSKHEARMKAIYAILRYSGDPVELQEMQRAGIATGEEGDFGILPTPQISAWMLANDGELAAEIEQATGSMALGGFRQEGVTTVGQERILNTTARKKFAEPSIQVEQIASVVASRILELVDKNPAYSNVLGAEGKVLVASRIDGAYHARINFEVLDPVLQLQRQEVGLRELSFEAISLEDYLRDYKRVEDVTGYMRRILQDKVRKHPAVSSRLAVEAAQEMDPEIADAFEEGIRQDAVDQERDGRRGDQGGTPGSTEQLRNARQPLTDETAAPPREG